MKIVYKVLTANSPSQLSAKINSQLDNGWTLVGGVSSDNGTYSQALQLGVEDYTNAPVERDEVSISPAYLTNTHHHCFRPHVEARIIGVYFAKPANLDERLVYEIQYADGVIDYVPLTEYTRYVIDHSKVRYV